MSGASPLATAAIPARKSRRGLVLAWGDSWLGFVPFVMKDLRDWLIEWGYAVPEDYCRFGDWLTLERMVRHRHEFRDAFLRRHLPQRPRAIVLSCGGNDSVRSTLETLLNPRQEGVPVVNEERLADHIRRVKGQLTELIEAVREVDGSPTGIPILVHGYDHPVPANRGAPMWLRTPFFNRGYVDPTAVLEPSRADLGVAAAAMRQLIDALNEMLRALAQEHANLRHVDLRGTVQSLAPHDPASGWLDNMHPRAEGFRHMAARIAAEIEATPLAEGTTR